MTTTERIRTHRIAELSAVGENAVRVTGLTGDVEQDWVLAHKLAEHLHTESAGAFLGAVPTYESVLIEFDALTTDLRGALDALEDILDSLRLDEPLHPQSRLFRVPVLYGKEDRSDEFGPDMALATEVTGLSRMEIIERHTEPTYVIRCLGAPGGSPMVYGPDLGTPMPRLTSPRTRVPQGAVSLAGRQATITPTSAPGGWAVIGRTPLSLLDLTTNSLVPYRPGDRLQFFPVEAEEFRVRHGHAMTAEVAS